MTSIPPTSTPQDMRDLLIRLDEKVQNGFASITAKLDAMDRKTDDHDKRLKDVEVELGDRAAWKKRVENLEEASDLHDHRILTIETTARNAAIGIRALWAILGAAIIAIGARLVGLFH